MKNIYRISIFLCIAAVITATLYFIPLTPSVLSAMSVGDRELGSIETHYLDQDEAEQLVAALQGPAVHELPENVEASYELTLHQNVLPQRRYEVYITSDQDVYLKRVPGNQLIRPNKAHFFYTHAAFQSLYPFNVMPQVEITVAGEEIIPRVQKRRWEFIKWDHNWYHGSMRPLSRHSEKWPQIHAAESQLTFMVEPVPGRASLAVTDGAGVTVFNDNLTCERLPLFQKNGVYDYHLSLFWEDESQPYRGAYEASFSVVMDQPPAFKMPETIVQGELASFYFLHVPQGMMPVLELETGYPFQFYPYADGYVAYLPTHYGNSPGEYRLTYGLEGEPLNKSTIKVLPREFHVQHLRVDRRIAAATRNEAAYTQFARYFHPARESSTADRYYSEPFLLPASGRLTTEFGQTRYVNDEPTSYRHSGLDIAAPTGTPVLATNDGRVTLSMDLILTGNTVVIDHGQGLFSVYYHMHELFVEEGQLVARGETIGTVGSTGFSTGPHLHFTMSYYRHNLEPGYFLVGEPVTFENAQDHLQRK